MTVGCVCRMVEFPVRSTAGKPGNLRDNRCALLELSCVLKERERQGAKKSDVSTAEQISTFDIPRREDQNILTLCFNEGFRIREISPNLVVGK